MSDTTDIPGGKIAAGLATVGLLCAAIKAVPRLAHAVISTARTAVAINDAMPVVMQLPALFGEQKQEMAEQTETLKWLKNEFASLKQEFATSKDRLAAAESELQALKNQWNTPAGRQP